MSNQGRVCALLLVLLLLLALSACTREANLETLSTPEITASTAAAPVSEASAQDHMTTTETAAEALPVESDSVETEPPSQLEQVSTKYGTLSYPSEYREAFVVSVSEEGEGCRVDFSTEMDAEQILLFSVGIDDELGPYAAKLTDEAGSSHQVFILVAELEGIDRYPQDVQDTLYAMQEAVNVVFEHLN